MTTSQDKAIGNFADDEAALKRGRGGVAGALAVIVLLVAGGLFALMSGGDDERVYGELGRKINGLKQAGFDQFWGCALSGANLKDVKTNAELRSQLEGRASERGQPYALHLRDECLDKLVEIEPTLDNLFIPDDMKADTNALKAATSKLRSGFSAFISYLDNPELEYDSTVAGVYLDAITRAWFDFKQAHAALNKTLKARLEK